MLTISAFEGVENSTEVDAHATELLSNVCSEK